MRQIEKENRDQILKGPYMTADDIYQVLPVGKNQANRMFNVLYEELKERGVRLFESRPRTVPTKEFKKKYL